MHSHHHHHHHHEHSSTKGLWWVFALNLSFTIIEFIGGYFTDSIAIVSDAFHDLGDSLAIAGAIFLEKIAQRNSNSTYTYGYKRYSTLSALAISLMLIGGSIFVAYSAIPRLLNPQQVHSTGMIWLAILGVAINGGAAFKLIGKKNSLNQRAIMLHLLEDTLGWVAVLLGATVIHFTDYYIIDPILSLIIAIYILFGAFNNLKRAFNIMLQKAPDSIKSDLIKAEIEQNSWVCDVHDLHIWTLDGEKNVATIHIRLNSDCNLNQMSQFKKEIRSVFNANHIQHVTIEFDSANDDCALTDC
ncbi:MAG: cation diffusion facilitator family transporter [Bacteroidia bacterium]